MSRAAVPGLEATADERAPVASPPRLIELGDTSGDPVAAALVAANRLWQADATEEARAWYALRRRRAPRREWRAGALVLAAVAIAVLAVLAARRPSRSPEIVVAPLVAPVPVEPAALSGPPPESPAAGGGGDVTAARASENAGMSLPAPILGGVVAANGVRVRLSRQGVATLLSDSSDQAAIALARGQLDIDADGAPAAASGGARPPEAISVRASSLRILGDGGHFHVDTDGTRVGVTVESGAVRVYSSRRLLARVVAGQHWTFAPRAGATPARAPALEPGAAAAVAPAAAAPDLDCLAHARAGSTDRAIACFLAQSATPGLSAEVALLEIARLRRDVSGDLGGAEHALDEYRRRFPHGTLSVEAGIARVELLLRLGRANDALDEARALPEGEGDFWRAVCLAKLGRRDEARAAFDGYLARPDATRLREAQRRRAELAP
jgi:hypothetical protein